MRQSPPHEMDLRGSIRLLWLRLATCFAVAAILAVPSLGSAGGIGIPLDTVDEKTIWIAPEVGPHRTAMAVLIPGPGFKALHGYFLHRVEFPGYVALTTTGTGIRVGIRNPMEPAHYKGWDDYDGDDSPENGQTIPLPIESLFVIETHRYEDGTSTPISFTSPVNIVIEFAPPKMWEYDDPSRWDDFLTLSGDLATTGQMGAVRDMKDGPRVDYRMIHGKQDLDITSGTVTVRDYSPLTDASGRSVYGAVGFPTYITPSRWRPYR